MAAVGALLAKPRAIPVGRVVVADPFGSGLVLDLSKGCYQTGHSGRG